MQPLLPNMYHDNGGRLSAHHTLLPNMYHDNGGRLSAHHTLLPNMYHNNRGRFSAHHTFGFEQCLIKLFTVLKTKGSLIVASNENYTCLVFLILLLVTV